MPSLAQIPVPSYPSRCLDFLKDSNAGVKGQSQTKTVEASQVPLKVIIVGAGLGGLATAVALARRGHSVTVLEQAPELAEVGAGIQIPANSSRLLLSWGLEPYLKDYVIEPEGMSFRRWENGKVIGHTQLVPDFRQSFKAPYYVIHRAHFHEALHKHAIDLGVNVKVNHRVVDYDLQTPSVRTANGKLYSADLIIAADGVKSIARSLVLGGKDNEPRPTGFAAYRATVPVEKMKTDPEISWLLEKPNLNIWIGEDRHVMTYTIASGKSFNMVLSHVDRSDPAIWKQETAVEDMKNYFKGWDPKLTKIISMIDKCLKWPLMSGSPLSNWVAPSGKVLILGDAAHAMVPYMSQGAAMAVEDGAALAESLSHISSRGQLLQALKIFETERIERSSQMQEASLLNGKLWHFADGPEQRARDEGMRPEVEGKHFLSSSNQWSDPATQNWAYGYDAEEVVVKAWRRVNKEAIKTTSRL